ncbi:MAG: aminodeoxychorismate/anthranilate synthase component II [Rikenellaceae bacterium]
MIMHKKILIFDNYDSFTYNLVHAIRSLGYTQFVVRRNDQITLDEAGEFDKILLSPGPGIPEEAGLLLPLVKKYASTKSIFGVCLGQQAIAESFGGSLINLATVCHGISTPIKVTDTAEYLFKGLPESFEGGRYHSWVVNPQDFPSCLNITAQDQEGQIMALSHKEFDVRAVQFHPESVLTPLGEKIIFNWLQH